MLLFGCKVGEELVIGGGIRLTVLEIQGERVRLGIEAPRAVPVRRAELNSPAVSAGAIATPGWVVEAESPRFR